MSILHKLAEKPIIAALRNPEDIRDAIESKVDHIFFMGGSITQVISAVKQVKQAGKGAFIHVDLIRGLSSTDKETIEFITEYMKADGIVTPKNHLIKEAKRNGLYTILHLFMLDSFAMENGLRLVADTQPDAVELMPGVIPKVIHRFADHFSNIPIIASGMVETVSEAAMALDAGATALSVSEKSLWKMDYSDFQLDI